MKKLLAFLLALALVMALSACDQIPGMPPRSSSFSTPAPTNTPAAEKDEPGDAGDQAGDSNVILPDEDGFAYGFIGNTLRTAFFDFTVNSAYLCAEYEGYTPSEGNTILVCDVTFYNYTIYSQPMFDDDLQAQWSSEEEQDYALPITEERKDLYPNTGVEPTGDMFPQKFSLGIQETRQGLLVYEVPDGETDYSLSYLECFEDNTYGDTFFVFFTPEVRTQQA